MIARNQRSTGLTGARVTRGAGGAVAAIFLLATVAACSGGGSETASREGNPDSISLDKGNVVGDAPNAAPGGLGTTRDGSAGHSGEAARVPVQTQQVIFTGKVALRTKDLDAARQDLDRLLGRFGGYVADEKTITDDDGRTATSTLTLRLPSARFGEMMDSFTSLGTVTSTGRDAVDVTTEVIDVAARIRTQEVSLRRLHKFLGRSSNIDTIIRLESEIARREADLASMRSQQNYLDDQTSLATISLEMTRTSEAAVPPKKKDPLENAGFVTGLRNGWNALLDILLVAATVLGAVLPFLVVATVLGVPLMLWLRATRRRRAGPEPATTAAP